MCVCVCLCMCVQSSCCGVGSSGVHARVGLWTNSVSMHLGRSFAACMSARSHACCVRCLDFGVLI